MSAVQLPPFYSIASCLFKNKQYQLLNIIDNKNCGYFIKQPSSDVTALTKMELEYEFTLLKKINSDITLKPVELNFQNQPPVMLLQHATGQIFSTYFKKNNPDYQAKCQIAIALTSALISLHKLNITHQNLTPLNVLITPHQAKSFTVKFIDLTHATEFNLTNSQASKKIILESHYFSPEQTGKVNQVVDYRTDFYNLGLLLYELFIGDIAFQADSLQELVYLHIAQVASLKKLFNQPALVSIISKLLQKDPCERYQNGQSLRDDLAQAIQTPYLSIKDNIAKQDGVFRISSALFGRDRETKLLLKAAEETRNGPLQLVLISGDSGMGKSVLAKKLHPSVIQHSGNFLSGKFEQLGIKSPLKAFIQAFKSLIQQRLTEPKEAIAAWKQHLQEAVGQNAQVLCEVLPELKHVFSRVITVPQLSPSDELNRFIITFKAFIQVSCIDENLTVLFLDDMQWADEASLLLLEHLCSDFSLHRLLIVCAYRNNEVDDLHIFSKAIRKVEAHNRNVKRIELAPLTGGDITKLLQASLNVTVRPIHELTKILLEKTQGTPFFTLQLLDSLWQSRLLYFKDQAWQWDIDAIKAESFTDNVIDLMSMKITKLSYNAIELLKTCSAIGNRFSLNLLLHATNLTLDELVVACNTCLQEKLLLLLSGNQKALYLEVQKNVDLDHFSDIELKFTHDKIQQAAYELIQTDEHAPLHVKIGRKMYQRCDDKLLEENLFDITTQINQGTPLLTATEKVLFAELNHRAATKAKRSGAYQIALNLLLTSQKLLPHNLWKKNHKLAYGIHLSLLEVQYLCTLYPDASTTSKIILKNTPELIKQIPVFKTQILNCIANNKMENAVVKCASAVNSLGFDLVESPLNSKNYFTDNALMATDKEISTLANLPLMNDEYAEAALSILAIGCAPAYFSSSKTFAKFCNTMLSLCITKGNSSDSAYAYAIFGLYCSGLEQHKSAYKFCEIGLKMLEKFNNHKMKPQIYEIFNVHVKHWIDPFRDSLPNMHEGVVEGKRTGGIEFASYNAAFSCPYLLFSGKSMSDIWRSGVDYWTLLTQFNQIFCITYASIWLSLIQKIKGIVEIKSNVADICESTFAPYTDIDVLLENNNKTTLYSYYQSNALYYLYTGDYKEAYQYAHQAEHFNDAMYGMRNLLENEVCLAISIAMSSVITNRDQAAKNIQQCLAKLIHWDKIAQGENTHKILLIKAMLALQQDNEVLALSLLQQASQLAVLAGFMQDHTICQLLSFEIYNKFADEHIKLASFVNAIKSLADWGAFGVVAVMLSRFPDMAKDSNFVIQQRKTKKNDTERTNPLFKEDMAILLDTLKSLSSEMDELSLQQKILHTVATIAGAEKAHLLDVSNQEPTIITSFKNGNIIPLFYTDSFYSRTALNYCLSTHQTCHTGDALNDTLYQKDLYVQKYKVRSILCLPIIGKKSILAALYLENYMSPHCFNEQVIQKINILVKQSAMNLENAQLYTALTQENEERKLAELALAELNSELEHRVVERTHALQNSNKELANSLLSLQQAQSKLVESEKMASLGGLVAGVAHEVNTPIGVGLGAATHLLNIVNAVNTDYKNGTLTESSFKKMLNITDDSMEIVVNNLQRAAELIHSFKRVSIDQTNEELIEFELVEYIQTVLNSLKPKYRHLYLTLKITGLQKLLIHQMPGAIAQLTTNLVLNSIVHGFSNKTGGDIEIRISEHLDDVILMFIDNGVGIKPSKISKIFDPFYTTTRGQGGSGLGLHIAYNLVTQTLRGVIDVKSYPEKGTTFTIKFPKKLSL